MKHIALYSLLFFIYQLSFAQDDLVQRYPKLNQIPVNDIMVDRGNRLWIGTEDGLFKLQGIDFDKEYVRRMGVYNIVLDKEGNGWMGLYSNKLALIDSDKIYSTGIDETDMIRSMGISEDAVWVGTQKGLYKLSLKSRTETFHFTETNSKLISNNIHAVYVDLEGKKWIGTDNGLSEFKDADKWAIHLEDLEVSAITQDREGNLWVAADRALWKLNLRGKWQKIPLQMDLRTNIIRDLIFDYNGNLWLASNMVAKYDPKKDQFFIYDRHTGFTSSQALCLAVDQQNGIWVGTGGKGLFKIANEMSDQPLAFGTPKGKTKTVIPSRSNQPLSTATLASTDNSGLTHTNIIEPSSEIDPILNEEDDEMEEPTKESILIAKERKVIPKAIPKKKSKKKTKTKRPKRKRFKKSQKAITKTVSTRSRKSKKNIKANINFLGRRLIKEGTELEVRDTQIEIAIWDGQDMDGDTISLYYNGECILKGFNLTKDRQYFNLKINPRTFNHLVLYAHSQGSLGFATATVAVTGKDQPKEWIVLNSDLEKCDKINFNFVR